MVEESKVARLPRTPLLNGGGGLAATPPLRCVVFIADAIAADEPVAGTSVHPAVDRVALLGSSGRVRFHGQSDSNYQRLLQLLGVDVDVEGTTEERVRRLRQRFPRLRVALFTDSTATRQVTTDFVTYTGPLAEFEDDQLGNRGCDVVVVHAPTLSRLDDLCARQLANKDSLVVVVGPCSQVHPQSVHPFRPVQSWQVKEGQTVIISSNSSLAATVAYHHPDFTRQDRGRHFSAEEALGRGCLGDIGAFHFMHELAYKVGRAPKYGA